MHLVTIKIILTVLGQVVLAVFQEELYKELSGTTP